MGYALTALIILGIATNGFWLLMKSRVNEKLQGADRISEWSRSFQEVIQEYRKLRPNSYLPTVATATFVLSLIILAALVIVSVTQK